MESVLVNIQDFTLNGSDQVCDGALFLPPCYGSVFLVKLIRSLL